MAKQGPNAPPGGVELPAGPGGLPRTDDDDLDRSCQRYLSAVDDLCRSSGQLAAVIQRLARNTPLGDVISQWEQTWTSLEKSSLDAGRLIQQEVATSTRSYRDEGGADSEKNLLILARIFFLLFQSQSQFWGYATQMMLPLQEVFKEPQDLLLGGSTSDWRQIYSSWIRAMQAADSLRLGEVLSQAETKALMESGGTETALKQKLMTNMQVYANEMLKLPTGEIHLRAGFQGNLSLLSTLLSVSTSAAQGRDLLDRLTQDQSLQYLNQIHLEKTGNATTTLHKIKNYLTSNGTGYKLLFDGKPCSDTADVNSRLSLITSTLERILPSDTHLSPDMLSVVVALNIQPELSSLQTIIAVQLVFGHQYLVTIRPPASHSVVEITTAQSNSLLARTCVVWTLTCGHPALEENARSIGTVEALYEYSMSFAQRGYSSSTSITLRLNRDEETLRSIASEEAPQRALSPLAVLNVDGILDQITKNFIGLSITSPSPPIPESLDLQHEQSRRQSAPENSNLPAKPQTLVGPTVTITSELSPTEELRKWAPLGSSRFMGKYKGKPNLASDSEVQDIVDFLSGGPPKQPPQPPGALLDPPAKSPQESMTPNSSSSSSSNHSSGWGSLGGGETNNAIRYGSYNPQFQEVDNQYGGHRSPSAAHGLQWGMHPHPAAHQQMAQMFPGDPRLMADPHTEAEFEHYVAANAVVKRVPLTADHSPSRMQRGGYWTPTTVDQMNRTWPNREGDDSRKNSLNNTWSTAHDSASSSDESSNNGEGALSMGLGLSGQNLLHSVSRRRHSSDDACENIKPTEPVMMGMNPHFLDVIQMDSKSTKTWPPKVVWQQQRALSPQNPAVGSHRELGQPPAVPKDTLNVHPPLTPQWSDPVTFRNQQSAAGWGYITGSTPVSPAGSMSMIPNPYMAMNSSPRHQMSRGHPKLDRRAAHPGHFS